MLQLGWRSASDFVFPAVSSLPKPKNGPPAAVGRFLREEISFGMIPELVARALDAIPVKSNPDLEDILEADRQARRIAAC